MAFVEKINNTQQAFEDFSSEVNSMCDSIEQYVVDELDKHPAIYLGERVTEPSVAANGSPLKSGHVYTQVGGANQGLRIYSESSGWLNIREPAGELLNKIKTVDGSGSDLDSDKLDGLHAWQFLRSDVPVSITQQVSYDHPESGSAALEWEDNYLRYRFGGTSLPKGIRLDHYDTPVVVLNRLGASEFNQGLKTSEVSAKAATNSATDYPALLHNSAGTLTAGFGAYGFSNKLSSSQTSDFKFEVGGDLVLNPTSRVVFESAAPILEIKDTDSSGNAAGGLLRFRNSVDAVLGFFGLASTSNEDVYLYSSSTLRLGAGGATKAFLYPTGNLDVLGTVSADTGMYVAGIRPLVNFNETDVGAESRIIAESGRLYVQGPANSFIELTGYNGANLQDVRIRSGGVSNVVWHQGNFDPDSKASASHNHNSVYYRKDVGEANGPRVSNTSQRQFILYDVAMHSSTTTTKNGTLVIQLGVGGQNTMYNGELVISRNYHIEPTLLTFAGYARADGSWIHTSACTNQPDLISTVRFGRDPAGNPCILLSNDPNPTESTWESYVSVRLKSVDLGWYGASVYQNQDPTNYTSDWIQDETGYTFGSNHTPEVMWRSYNDGSGSGLDADKVNGLQAWQFLRSDTADVKTSGILTFNDGVWLGFGTNNKAVQYYDSSSDKLYTKLGSNTWTITDSLNGDATRFTFSRWNGEFTAAGDVKAFSDLRLKKNIEVITDALEKLKSIRGVTYDRIDTRARQAGVIAQEVQKVLPEVVSSQTVDGEETLTVAYGNLASLLIEAVKELNEKVDALTRERVK